MVLVIHMLVSYALEFAYFSKGASILDHSLSIDWHVVKNNVFVDANMRLYMWPCHARTSLV